MVRWGEWSLLCLWDWLSLAARPLLTLVVTGVVTLVVRLLIDDLDLRRRRNLLRKVLREVEVLGGGGQPQGPD